MTLLQPSAHRHILKTIGSIYEGTKRCDLDTETLQNLQADIQLLAQYLQTTETGAFFAALIFSCTCREGNADLNDLARHLGCSTTKLLEYLDDFEALTASGIVQKSKVGSRHRRRDSPSSDIYKIHPKIIEAIIRGQPFPENRGPEPEKDVLGVLEAICDLLEKRDDNEISTYELIEEAKGLWQQADHFPLFQQIHSFGLEETYTLVYIAFIWMAVSGKQSFDIDRTADRIFDDRPSHFRFLRRFMTDENPLVQRSLIEIEAARFLNDAEARLTDTSYQILKDCDINLFFNEAKKDNLIAATGITPRQLIFDLAEMSQLETLRALLEEEKYAETRQRLAQKGLPQGLTVLLHGAPGTGKTEIVKQLAHETGRDIMKVEISGAKSMWFGESEKRIKRIFTDYRACARTSKQTPILFFNEADAILGKRRESSTASTAQTENAIQNILLEELENFEGIFMATTNMAMNLDSAFERRFLFKVRFEAPSVAIRAQIWSLRLPQLSPAEAQTLAARFSFSGGQIDNIVRKCEIEEIVGGRPVRLETLLSFCEAETLAVQRSRIGFGAGSA